MLPDIIDRRWVQSVHPKVGLDECLQQLVVVVVVEMLPLEIQQTLCHDVPVDRVVVLPLTGLLGSQVRQVPEVITGLFAALLGRKGRCGATVLGREWRSQCQSRPSGWLEEVIGLIHNKRLANPL